MELAADPRRPAHALRRLADRAGRGPVPRRLRHERARRLPAAPGRDHARWARATAPGGSSTSRGSASRRRRSSASRGAWATRGAALGAALLFVLYHLSAAARGGRASAIFSWRSSSCWRPGAPRAPGRSGGARVPLLWGGLAAGAGVMIKPQAALFWIACAGVAALGARAAPAWSARSPSGARQVSPCPSSCMGWLAWRGGAGPFAPIITGYVLPLYSRVGRVSVWEGIRWHVYGWQIWSCLIVLGVARLRADACREPYGIRRWLALARRRLRLPSLRGAGQGMGVPPLPVRRLPLRAGLRPARRAGEAGRAVTVGGAAPALSRALTLALLVAGRGAPRRQGRGRGRRAVDSRQGAPRLRPGPRSRGLCAGRGPGAGHGRDRAAACTRSCASTCAQPTRFLYDFHFFHDEGGPAHPGAPRRVRPRSRARSAPPPSSSSRTRGGAPATNGSTGFPPWRALLERDYTLAVEGDGYRIYAKRARS